MFMSRDQGRRLQVATESQFLQHKQHHQVHFRLHMRHAAVGRRMGESQAECKAVETQATVKHTAAESESHRASHDIRQRDRKLATAKRSREEHRGHSAGADSRRSGLPWWPRQQCHQWNRVLLVNARTSFRDAPPRLAPNVALCLRGSFARRTARCWTLARGGKVRSCELGAV